MSDEKDPPDAPVDYGELLLRANARPEYIAQRFADVLRGLMRGVGAQDPSGPTARAASDMHTVWELIQRCEEPIGFRQIFEAAVQDVRENLWDRESEDRRETRVALDGLMYLVEHSCHDSAASGRASKRYSAFRQSAEYTFGRRQD